MYYVKIIITNQNLVNNTTAETLVRIRVRVAILFAILLNFAILFAILLYFAILFTILEKNCNTFCNT